MCLLLFQLGNCVPRSCLFLLRFRFIFPVLAFFLCRVCVRQSIQRLLRDPASSARLEKFSAHFFSRVKAMIQDVDSTVARYVAFDCRLPCSQFVCLSVRPSVCLCCVSVGAFLESNVARFVCSRHSFLSTCTSAPCRAMSKHDDGAHEVRVLVVGCSSG